MTFPSSSSFCDDDVCHCLVMEIFFAFFYHLHILMISSSFVLFVALLHQMMMMMMMMNPKKRIMKKMMNFRLFSLYQHLPWLCGCQPKVASLKFLHPNPMTNPMMKKKKMRNFPFSSSFLPPSKWLSSSSSPQFETKVSFLLFLHQMMMMMTNLKMMKIHASYFRPF